MERQSLVTGQNSKRVLYVGGLAEEVTEETLRAAFIPFGDLLEVMIPMDYQNRKNRGFGFVEFELRDDAHAAVDNMDRSELFGRVLSVNVAREKSIEKNRAVWDVKADEFFGTEAEGKLVEDERKKVDEEKRKKREELERAPKKPRMIETSV